MLFASPLIVLAGLAAVSSPALARTSDKARMNVEARATSYCDVFNQVDVEAGLYTAFNNLWGKNNGVVGNQCITINSARGGIVNWDTTWKFSGGNPNGVKSYSNIQLNKGVKKTIASIKSLQSEWSWAVQNVAAGSVYNVAYDLFLAKAGAAKASQEIMIWLSAAGGALPASHTGKPVASLTIAGYKWSLYEGTVDAWTVYSFVTAQGDIKSFKGDLKLFLNYLTSNKGVPTSNIMTILQSGTEPYRGGATLKTSAYRTISA